MTARQSRYQEHDHQPQPVHHNQSVSSYGDKQESVISWPDYLTVKETARLLNVSERSVYGYLEKEQLPFTHQGNLLVVETAAVRSFRRQAAGRPRVRQPEWHRSSSDNSQLLTHITVQVRVGKRQTLEQCLEQIHASNRHQLPGTIARYIARSPVIPERVVIVLIWRKAAMPPREDMLAAVESLYEELNGVLDWESAAIQECEILLHT